MQYSAEFVTDLTECSRNRNESVAAIENCYGFHPKKDGFPTLNSAYKGKRMEGNALLLIFREMGSCRRD